MRGKKIEEKIAYYREKKKSVIREVQEIHTRYQQGLIDFQLYYETLLKNYQGNPRKVLDEYDRRILFYENRLEIISAVQRMFVIFFLLFLVFAFMLKFNYKFTGFLLEDEIPGNEIPEEQSLTNETSLKNNVSLADETNLDENHEFFLPFSGENATEPHDEAQEALIQKHEIVNESASNLTISNFTITEDYTLHETYEQPVIGQPVRWTKRITKEREGRIEINLPEEAENITLTNEQESLSITGFIGLEIEPKRYDGFFSSLLEFFKMIFGKITGGAIGELEKKKPKKVILDQPGDYEIVYYTPAPQTIEEIISESKKKVIVYGPDLEYRNIATFTEIPEIVPLGEKNAIHIFWKEQNKEIEFTAEDTNDNGIIDTLIWNTEHLSNQTFEISIAIITVQSYPTVGGNWIVEFTTVGNANLSIRASDSTTWSDAEGNTDLQFLEMRCGDAIRDYQWINEDVFIENYNCSETGYESSLVITSGKHTLEFNFGGIKRYAYNFAVGKRLGMLAYGEGAVQNPRYQLWNGTGFGGELSANNVGGTLEWLRVKASPVRNEYLLLTADANDDINVQINSSLGGVGCWHNGTICGSVLELETDSTIVNRLKADVSYEQITGDAIAVFLDNTVTPKYRVWNGTLWSSEAGVPQTLLTGIVNYVKMASHPASDEIALIFSNTSALDIMIWNGTTWTCEPSTLPSIVLTPDVFQHADLAYEKKSGDLFVASSIDLITEIDYTAKPNGSCSYTTARTIALREEGEVISIGPKFGSDYIMIAQHDIGANDMHAIIWNGTSLLAASGNEISLYGEVSPNLIIASGWAGTSNRGILLYSDSATSFNIDYFLYNTTENMWEGGVAGLNAFGLTNFTDEEEDIISYSFIDENKTIFIVRDEADDLWAKIYNAETNSWSEPDRGIALETSLSAPEFPSFDFAWKMFEPDIVPPLVAIFNPENITYTTSSVLFNFSLDESGLCNYSLDGGITNYTMTANSSSTGFIATNSSIADGFYAVSAFCQDTSGNSNFTAIESFSIETGSSVTLCRELSKEDTAYFLQNNVTSTGTCFTISASNITLDCQGNAIVYSSSGDLGNGISSLGANNTMIQNCIIQEGSEIGGGKDAIDLYRVYNVTISNSTIITISNALPGSIGILISTESQSLYIRNSIITSTSYGILASHFIGLHVENNQIRIKSINQNRVAIYSGTGNAIIESNTIITEGVGASGLDVHTDNNIIRNNNITLLNESVSAILLGFLAKGNNFTNNSITIIGNNSYAILMQGGGGNSTSYNRFEKLFIFQNNSLETGYAIVHADNNNYYYTIIDAIINSSASSQFFANGSGIWNFTNVTRSNHTSIVSTWDTNADGTFNVHWWVETTANYTNNSFAPDVNISSLNILGDMQFNFLTDLNGRISRQSLLEYKQAGTGGSIKSYFSNYTFNATNGLENLSQSLNITTNRNVIFTFFSNVTNSLPNITNIDPIEAVNLIENGTRNLSITFTVTDSNGVADINEITAYAEFSRENETNRSSLPGTCIKIIEIATSATITCNVSMFFYDAPGVWDVTVKINDTLAGYDQENSTFTVNLLNSITLLSPSPTVLLFPSILPENTDLQSTNDPLTIKNTGNYEGPLILRASDLYGLEFVEDKIDAIYFASSSLSGSECSGTFLQNATDITIIGSNLARGPEVFEDLFICLKEVPNVAAQEYSTSAQGGFAWTIRILLVGFIPRRNSKRKEKLRSPEEIDKKNEVLRIISTDLEKIEHMGKKHGITSYDIFQHLHLRRSDPQHIFIPFSIFSRKIGMLEAVCKYLKDQCGMRFHEIARLLSRNERTIWVSYSQACKKNIRVKEKISLEGIPLYGLQSEKLSILEAAIIYLRTMRYRYSEIASLLDRDERNIWTAAKRAEKKIKL